MQYDLSPQAFPWAAEQTGTICANSIASVQGLPPEPGSEGTASHTILSADVPPHPFHKAPGLSFAPLMVGEGSASTELPMGVMGWDPQGCAVGVASSSPRQQNALNSCVGAGALIAD